MSEELPEAVRNALDEARTQVGRRRTRMKVRAGGQEFTILRHWDSGFALDPAEAPLLRGLVDLYDGGRHLCQALVVTSREEAGERVFEFKYANRVTEGPPAVDFVRDDPAPGWLPPA